MARATGERARLLLGSNICRRALGKARMVDRQETAMLPWISIVVVLVAAYLTWNLNRRLRADRITALNERRRAASRFVSRGELVDGNRHLAVALALTESTFFYESSEMEASIDLEWVREIEY